MTRVIDCRSPYISRRVKTVVTHTYAGNYMNHFLSLIPACPDVAANTNGIEVESDIVLTAIVQSMEPCRTRLHATGHFQSMCEGAPMPATWLSRMRLSWDGCCGECVSSLHDAMRSKQERTSVSVYPYYLVNEQRGSASHRHRKGT
ncbi:Hypothetical protein H16_B0035 [Cupriavidus necator H16]|uniref:Uncharacterized protein n=1 Tax=Cupriavidus necator (strain ATCC 17699 / DSM 428 / KCTC 22496 / NCIMB 10442 / H16 / Stanier 337) TaxID=381666 RepID=Q0K583_CUPNH|nr:Hypothetical protein H16_B0035 [Cupriavidus necator H16]